MKFSISIQTETEEGGEESPGDGVDSKSGLRIRPDLSLNITRGMRG